MTFRYYIAITYADGRRRRYGDYSAYPDAHDRLQKMNFRRPPPPGESRVIHHYAYTGEYHGTEATSSGTAALGEPGVPAGQD